MLLAGLVGDYAKYKDTRNITFIGICSSSTATVKSMAAQVKTFGLHPFANMLDAGGVTSASYGVPKNAKFWLILLDGDGKIAYNDAGMGWHWTSGPDTGKTVFQTQLEGSFAKSKGLLGDEQIHPSMKYAAHLFDLQQFDLMEAELTKTLATDATGDQREVAALLRGKVSELRKRRMGEILMMSKSDPVQAYRDAIAFVEAFPKSPEMQTLRTVGTKLMSDAKVQRELAAEAGFQQIMVPVMKRTNTPALYDKNMGPLLDGYLKAYGDTQYADVVKNSVESLRLAVNTKR